MANELDFDYSTEEQEVMDAMSEMSEAERDQMLHDLFEREVLQPVAITDRDFLAEVFQILEGEAIEAQKGHILALGRYYAAKLSLAAA